MIRPTHQNPFDPENVIQAPIKVVTQIAASKRDIDALGVSADVMGSAITDFYSTNIQQFVSNARRQHEIGGLEQQGLQSHVPGLSMQYQRNHGLEKLTLTAYPEQAGEGLKNRFYPTGCYVLLQLFADDVTGTGHKHDVAITFSKELSTSASIVFSRSDNIDVDGTAFYQGVFLLKLPHLPLTLGKSAFSVTVSGVMDYVPEPSVGSYEYACGAVVSQGWVGPNWGDTDGTWVLMTAAFYNANYVDAYFSSVSTPVPLGFHLTDDVIWVRPVGGSDDPFLDDGWKPLYSSGILTPCPGFTPPVAPPSKPFPLGFQLLAFVYPLKSHVVFSDDQFFPIRKQLTGGALTDGVDLWDLSNNASNLASTLTDGTYSFAVERRQYLVSDVGKVRRALMCYPTTPMTSYSGGTIPYDIPGFRLQDDGTDLIDDTTIFDSGPGGISWVVGIPSGPPPLLTTDPLVGEKVAPRLTYAELSNLPADGTAKDFDSWT